MLNFLQRYFLNIKVQYQWQFQKLQQFFSFLFGRAPMGRAFRSRFFCTEEKSEQKRAPLQSLTQKPAISTLKL
jgi:hypothetical protein